MSKDCTRGACEFLAADLADVAAHTNTFQPTEVVGAAVEVGAPRRSTRRRSALVTRLQEELEQTDGVGHQDRSVEHLHNAVATLDPLDQEIIRLVHWEGFSQAEVAQILNRPAGTIRSRYARARSALRSELGDLSSQDR